MGTGDDDLIAEFSKMLYNHLCLWLQVLTCAYLKWLLVCKSTPVPTENRRQNMYSILLPISMVWVSAPNYGCTFFLFLYSPRRFLSAS